MHGVVTLLPAPYKAEVETIWMELEQRFGLRGIRITPFAHFSWEIAQDYPIEPLRRALQELAAESAPLVVRTGSIGIFTSSSPVIYIGVTKTAALARLHQRLWQKLEGISGGRSQWYSPANWVPHISLAYADVTPAVIGGVVNWLSTVPLRWEMIIDHFAFIEEPDGSVGKLAFQVKFEGPA